MLGSPRGRSLASASIVRFAFLPVLVSRQFGPYSPGLAEAKRPVAGHRGDAAWLWERSAGAGVRLMAASRTHCT